MSDDRSGTGRRDEILGGILKILGGILKSSEALSQLSDGERK
jgi:hypothetical protein